MRIFTFLYGQNTLNKQTSALRLKKDWMGIPHARASGESLSSQGQLFVKQTSLLLLPERTHLFSRAESLPPLPERQMDRSTSYPMETPSFKISESVSCDKKTHCPHVVYIWLPLHHLMENWGKKNQHELHYEVIEGLISDAETSLFCYAERERLTLTSWLVSL